MKNGLVETMEKELADVCGQGVEKGVFPGAAAAVSFRAEGRWIRIISTVGKRSLSENVLPVNRTTLFDLASLTKPLVTALSIFQLVEKGQCGLKDELGPLLGEKIPQDKQNITIEQLLSHSSGLTPYRPYFRKFEPVLDQWAGEKLVRNILADPLEYETGTDCRYSDMGFILLGKVIQQISGLDVAEYFRINIAGPMGLEQDLFFPEAVESEGFSERECAPTGFCHWRNRLMVGEVHDEHAWLLGKTAGHAGLFGTIDGVTGLLGQILDRWRGRKSTLPLATDILTGALQRKYSDRSWCLGFDTPSETGYTSAGSCFSATSTGHLGFTGTSFWMDGEKDCLVVLLSNRVHPDPENNRIRDFRPWFHDRIMELLTAVKK